MYSGQFEMTSFLSVSETSFAVQDVGSCSRSDVENSGSFSAARLATPNTPAPAPVSTPRRLRPGPATAHPLPTPNSRSGCRDRDTRDHPSTRESVVAKQECNELRRGVTPRPVESAAPRGRDL